MTHEDISRSIPDYVLGLLTPKQLGAVEQHVAHCPDCRQLLRREKRISQLVRVTVDKATTPDAIRLQRLMPATPPGQGVVWHPPSLRRQGWQRQLAPVLLLLLLVLGGFILQRTLPEGSVPSFVVTAHAATATTTHTPTATLAQSFPDVPQKLVLSPALSEAEVAAADLGAGHEQFDVVVKARPGPAMPVPSPKSEQSLATPVAAIIEPGFPNAEKGTSREAAH